MSYSYSSLLSPHYTQPGISERVYLAPVRWFATNGIAVPTPPFDEPGKMVTIRQDHAFAHIDYGFIQVQLPPERNAYEAKSVGGRETQKLEHTVNVFFPGTYSLLHETLMQMLNEPFIILLRDSTCEGKMYYQLGDPVDYAWLQADWETGTTRDGVKGYNCRFTWTAPSLLIYQGAYAVIEGDPDFDPANFLCTDFKTIYIPTSPFRGLGGHTPCIPCQLSTINYQPKCTATSNKHSSAKPLKNTWPG